SMVTLFSGMPERRRVVREARREREKAWRERYNTAAEADDLFRRTQNIPDHIAASVFGQPFVTASSDAQNEKTFAVNRAEEAEQHVDDVDAAYDTDAAADPLWPDGGGELPLLLLPVRLETLFRPSASGGAEMW